MFLAQFIRLPSWETKRLGLKVIKVELQMQLSRKVIYVSTRWKEKDTKMWGGYSPKVFDGNFLELFWDFFEEDLKGAGIVADNHFEWGQRTWKEWHSTLLSKVSSQTRLMKRVPTYPSWPRTNKLITLPFTNSEHEWRTLLAVLSLHLKAWQSLGKSQKRNLISCCGLPLVSTTHTYLNNLWQLVVVNKFVDKR